MNTNQQYGDQQLSLVEMGEAELALAQKVAKRLGFKQTAYTSTSAIPGLFCLPDHAKHKHGVLAQSKELGLIWIADLEDLKLYDLAEEERQNRRVGK